MSADTAGRGRRTSSSEALSFIKTLDSQGNALATCDIVLAEVHAGLYPEDRAAAEQLLATLEFLPTTREEAIQAGDWKCAYARRGRTLARS